MVLSVTVVIITAEKKQEELVVQFECLNEVPDSHAWHNHKRK